MNYKFIYINQETGERIYSFKRLEDKNLKPVFETKDSMIKPKKVIRKKYGK